MAKHLKIGSMKWPKESATKGFGFIGKRGSGKSYGAAVFAEELYEAGIPFVVFDPIDVWWGLKVAADGKGKGLPVVVFGKEHADVQLDRTMGRRIAQAVVKHNISCVISTFGLSKAEMREIITDFSEELLHINNSPRQVIIEEAHEFVPQRVMGAMARCFAAVEALLVMGRNRGIGVSLLNQRMATLNKDLLTQIDVLVAFRSVGPQDRKAFRDWVEVHAVDDEKRFAEFMHSVPGMPTGSAWVWSPEFLEVFEKVKFRKRDTFHPDREKLGVTFKMPEIKQGDVAAFIEAFNKKPEPRKDPRPVVNAKKLIVAAARAGAGVADMKDARQIEGLGFHKGFAAGQKATEKTYKPEVQRLTRELERVKRMCTQALLKTHGDMERALKAIGSVDVRVRDLKVERVAGDRDSQPRVRPPATHSARSIVDLGGMDALGRGACAILSYLASVTPEYRSKAQMWIATGYSPGGGFDNMVSELTARGLIEKDGSRKYRAVMPIDDSLLDPNFDASISKWDAKLGRGAKKVFDLLLASPEQLFTKVEIADATGYAQGGGFDNMISELSSKSLIVRVDRGYQVNPEVLSL